MNFDRGKMAAAAVLAATLLVVSGVTGYGLSRAGTVVEIARDRVPAFAAWGGAEERDASETALPLSAGENSVSPLLPQAHRARAVTRAGRTEHLLFILCPLPSPGLPPKRGQRPEYPLLQW